MELGRTFYTADRKRWRAWLEKNHARVKEIWLIFPNRSSGKPRLAYNDAVEEALCFGWIDSTVKKIDAASSAQRFSPRHAESGYSQANKERLKILAVQGKLIPAVAAALQDILTEEYVFPADILRAIRSSRLAWKNFRNFPPVYQRIRVAFIDGARKRPAEFRKRLAYLIRMSEKDKLFGFGGIDKYFRTDARRIRQ